ncbi:MAG: DoxX family protein [Bacteroidetes bacterium]|nr:DoxX family protein [Bacteroidota bacterium]
MKKKILFIVSLLFGLMFINAGLNKIFNYIPVPDDLPENMVNLMKALMAISWLIPLIAVVEIIGGVLFITNRFRALGALITFPIMIGIVLTHVINAQSGLPLVFCLLAINLWVMFENREKYMPLVK